MKNITKKITKHSLLLLLITTLGCIKNEVTVQKETKSFSGYAQKGPFINGSSISVFDLNAELSPTGSIYNVQITDNKGSFQLDKLSLSSNYVNLKADGFYFNEVTGRQSFAQITLNALCNVTNSATININILTHLEKSRVEYLIKSGKSYTDAKKQSRVEILNIFNIKKTEIKSFENLNIAENGDDNGILLAISSIIQGFRTEAELTELLSNMSNDIKDDGILDSKIVGSELINHTIILDTNAIKNNLAKRYADLGINVNIPSFGKHISTFITNTKFSITQIPISYPETGANGDNILSLTKTTYKIENGSTQSLATQLSKGTALKIKITSLPNTSNPQAAKTAWFYQSGSGVNWTISDFDFTNYTQTFTATESGKVCDLKMSFTKGKFLIEYYENNSSTPNRSKTIDCE